MKHEITFEKVVKFKALEFDNFYYINNQIKLKKQLTALGIDITKLPYDKAINIQIPTYAILDKKEVTKVAKMEVDWRGRPLFASGEKHWTERCYLPEKPYTVEQLEAADKDIANSLAWFCGYDHSLWDTDMKQISTPWQLGYINGAVDNERYKLKTLMAHLKQLPKSIVADLAITDIHDVPRYEESDSARRTFDMEVLLAQDVFTELMSKIPRRKEDKAFELHHKLGYYGGDTWDEIEALKTLLGFPEFAKPEVKDEDD